MCAVPWGCSVPWRVFSTVGRYHEYRGDILSTVGGVQYRGGYLEYRARGYHEYRGVILSTVGDTQYCGRYHDDVMSTVGENLLLSDYPTVLTTPMVLMISPTVLKFQRMVPPRY